jgi:hypothetical protein
MQYKPSITVLKTATPAAVIVAGSNILQLGAQALGVELGEEASYIAVTTVYSLFKGLQNWIKNRRKR